MNTFKHEFQYKIGDQVDAWFYDDNGESVYIVGHIINRKFYNQYLELHPAYLVESEIGESLTRWAFEHDINRETEPIKPKIPKVGKWELTFK